MPPPERRAAAPLASVAIRSCATCSAEKPQGGYWPGDWNNRHQSISCKECQPSPPSSRGTGRGVLNESLLAARQARNAVSYTHLRAHETLSDL
eukprot:10505583-Karenia_brevis.AAC.1